MTQHYEHVYMALRSSMIDRDAGDKIEDSIYIDMGLSHIALKKEIPSSAILIAYSMLYYPEWMKEGYPSLIPVAKKVEEFDGGVNNPKFRMFFNIQMVMIAAAVGSYAGLWNLKYSKFLHTTLIQPNLEHPVVKETRRLIAEEGLTFRDARNTFIGLMKDDEYAIKIPLADDYIANATFIPEATVVPGEEYVADVQHIDLSSEFNGADD